MNAAVNELTRAITGKESFDDCSIQELQQLCSSYPWFAAAHLLLAKKLHRTDPAMLGDTAQRAALYFPNPLILQQLITNDNAYSIAWEKTQEGTGYEIRHVSIVESVAEDEPPFDPEESVEELIADQAEPRQLPENDGIDVPDITDEQPADQLPPVDVPAQVNVLPKQTVLESPATTEEVVVQGRHALSEPREEIKDNEAPLTIAPLRLEPLDAAKATLTFEPYHTVDYFASQGIRVKDEEKPADRFSQQLKSFTEWLKTMKRVTPAEMQGTSPLPEEQKVEKLAEVSISGRDVVTEAMAEVWEKQGNHRKAIETYDKLSLINPSKSAYFAAKIEQLNKELS